MTASHAALLGGAFVVPALLLWAGHRLRRRPRWWRRGFWWALTAHVVAATAAVVVAVAPPEMWASDDWGRGLVGLWLPVVAPAVAGAVGAIRARRGGG